MKTEITHTPRINDGTTSGKEVLIDNNGKRYQPYSGSPKSLGINQTLLWLMSRHYEYI